MPARLALVSVVGRKPFNNQSYHHEVFNPVMKVVAVLFALTASHAAAQRIGLTVHTQQGDVSGTLVVPTVRQFLGIPYATAKRWQAPQLPTVRKTNFKATAFGDTCVQELSVPNLEFLKLTGGMGINNTESENCLSVNIWSPSVKRKQGTAVLLWIYGGGFVFGASNIPVYVGQNFVRDNDDITVVTINYRLNIFGQPNAPQLASSTLSQNFGLLDIEAAVKWVHTNIAGFGGDPERIVIFGQSAGSAAVDAYTFAHPHDTIVKGVIEQSGSISGRASAATSAAVNPAAWNSVAVAVGCGNTTNSAQLVCMEAVPFRALEDAVISTDASFNLVVDNITIFADTAARAAAGNFLQVPLLGGTTQHESDIFVLVKELVTTGIVVPSITEMLSDVQTLTSTCSAGVTALNRIKNNVPTWRYQYQGVFPDISTRSELRAYHAAEIPLVFGTYNSSTIPATPAEIALSRFIQGAWVAFARDPKQGLLSVGWPQYDPTTATLALLGNPVNQSGVVFTQGSLVDFACAHGPALSVIQEQLLSILSG
ncbi:Alpha/Beta hydrolase protein [Crassisporium funariophilum]|nr:Alpha/Beta hydrolase protein [Crassisporium funariophilum]